MTVAPAGTVSGPEKVKLAMVIVPAVAGADELGGAEVVGGLYGPDEPDELDEPLEHAAAAISSAVATPETSAVRFIPVQTRPGARRFTANLERDWTRTGVGGSPSVPSCGGGVVATS
ncbi:hypothetical protein GCM10009838_74550 [Catenulispora subtropica]|uniref:Uncharacterized protein n=1 Tax=Catenulispora subtropica TaxID=450798 RepID=A0ABP5EM92_9ACTN